MPSDISSQTSDELRMRNFRAQAKHRHDSELRELGSKHQNDVQRLLENQEIQKENLQAAYAIQISKEAEQLEEKLHQTRLKAENKISEEKRLADQEFEKVRTAHQQKIAEYRKSADAQMNSLRKELQATTGTLHEQAKKAAKREKEISGA